MIIETSINVWYNSYTSKLRIKYNLEKSLALKSNPKRGASFEDAQEIFLHHNCEDMKNDDPIQFRIIGWIKGQLYTLIYEVRNDSKGEYFHLITLWKSTTQERKIYEKETK